MNAPDEVRERWQAAGFPVIVEQPDEARFEQLVETAPVVCRDAGLTVVRSGTVTSIARWV